MEKIIKKNFVFSFEKGSANQKDLLGGKGANLAEMKKLGIPVPDGFTISTKACIEFYKQDKILWENLISEIFSDLDDLEKKSGKKLGCTQNPLLVSVRSGAKISMPGMMDTILNLGLNFDTVEALAQKSQNKRFAWDSFRRFIQMYSNVVLGISHEKFENIIQTEKKILNKIEDTEILASEWKIIVEKFLDLVQEHSGEKFPMDPKNQLLGAIKAVFESWNCNRAIYYRNLNNIDHNIGTAVNVQMMVFGNLGESSGTGVCFTRNPSTGENIFYGEFLLNAQGEDVVAGIRTPLPILELQEKMPKVYDALLIIRENLEKHFKDMQDIEFTIENKKLFILQTRSGKRSANASLRMAVEMVQENLISKNEALLRMSDEDIETLLHPQLDPVEKSKKKSLCKGLPASPGGVSGKLVFTSLQAVEAKKLEEHVILVRHETSPEDIAGMYSAEGILTACGGMTSHAAVVARGMGRPCVSGASDLSIDEKNGVLKIKNLILNKGDIITIDGSSGEVFEGKISKIPVELTKNFQTLLSWAKNEKKLEVRTNADTPKDTARAINFGAEGIGLCRTEHMFFETERIFEVRKMILSEDVAEREKTLLQIKNFQQSDFEAMFKVLDGKPICIRLLDPPLHEFLPQSDFEIQALAKDMNLSVTAIRERIEHLNEVNPMLGHRGCRLLLTLEGLLEAQINAILSAGEKVKNANIEIMIPLVSLAEEFFILEQKIRKIAENYNINFKLGTMIETPRACFISEKISSKADFFSFGTNDLTQMLFGFSRDDVGKFLPDYLNQKIIKNDPFQRIDVEGVGLLMQNVLKNLPENFKSSVCGEHGGDGISIEFFHQIGIKTVSCSPFRVPVTIIAAARAGLK